MKKLLLFIIVLFGSMSAMSLADGCMAQVCTCSNGGYVSYGEYCAATSSPSYSGAKYPDVWLTFSYDNTEKVYAIGEGGNKKTAESDALRKCGTSECKVIKSVKAPGNTLLIALSSNDIIEFKSFGHNEYNNNKTLSYFDDLLKKCKDKGGIDCKIVFKSGVFYYQTRAFKSREF